MDDLYREARPSRGHRGARRLVAAGKMPAVIAEHRRPSPGRGVPGDRVIELHGNGTYALCLSCGRRHELEQVRARFEAGDEPPACDACGGFVKSATISFGQAMPASALRRAQGWPFAASSSSSAHRSRRLSRRRDPGLAKRNEARVVIVNREPTDLDDAADLVINADIGAVLRRFSPW